MLCYQNIVSRSSCASIADQSNQKEKFINVIVSTEKGKSIKSTDLTENFNSHSFN